MPLCYVSYVFAVYIYIIILLIIVLYLDMGSLKVSLETKMSYESYNSVYVYHMYTNYQLLDYFLLAKVVYTLVTPTLNLRNDILPYNA